MQEQHAFPYLHETLVFLALAGILIPLLQRLRINQVLGFLAVGALLGPLGLGRWSEQASWLGYVTFMRQEGVAALGNIGVLFLMFMIGLELSADRLWALRRWVFGAGVAQVCLCATTIGALAWAFGNRIETAIVLGFVLSLSSTAVVMQLLAERRLLDSPLRQPAFSILMLQDLAVVPVFILLGVLSQGGHDRLWPLLATTLAKSFGAVLLIYFIGRRVMRPLFAFLARQRQPDAFMALILLATLGIAALTAGAGLSMALGAFLAGLLLAETEFRHEVEVVSEPFRGLLMGLFFMSVGMQTDVREIVRSPVWIPLSVAGLFLIKAALTGAVLRAGGFNWGRAIAGGLLLGQGGEFAFIVVGHAIAARLLEPAVGQFMMLVVALSLFATPAAAKTGELLARWWEGRHPQPVPGPEQAPAGGATRVVIAGFGRVGRLLARILEDQAIPYIALEADARVVTRFNAAGFPVYFGNAARAELLHKVHAGAAAAIVLTMDEPDSALHAALAIRREFPQVPLFARSRDEKHAAELGRAGATLIIPETLESALQLSGAVLRTLGVNEAAAARIIEIERARHIV